MVIFHIYRHERRKTTELGWPPVRVRNDVGSFLDRTDQLDLVTFSLHNPDQSGCGKPPLSLAMRLGRRIPDLPPQTSPPSKLDLEPHEVHSTEQNRVLVPWGVWPPAPAADRPRRCEAVFGCTPFATS